MLGKFWAGAFLFASASVVSLGPPLGTEPAGDDADDPAVWLHPRDISRSLILATNKVPAPRGALVVYGIDGRIRQRIDNLDRPNNVDVQDDLAIVTERLKQRLRLFRISESRITEIGGAPVFEGQTGPSAAPMGIAIYKRTSDGALFAIVSRKSGPANGYLWQYRINGTKLNKVREFGTFSGGTKNEIEAIAVDDELGFVYYADEGCCIRKYHADPDHPLATAEVGKFGLTGFQGNREGIAIHRDYVICTDQIPGASRYHLFPRRGAQSDAVAVLHGTADSTDGIEVVSQPLGPNYPRGLLIAMNSAGRNFLLFPWPALK